MEEVKILFEISDLEENWSSKSMVLAILALWSPSKWTFSNLLINSCLNCYYHAYFSMKLHTYPYICHEKCILPFNMMKVLIFILKVSSQNSKFEFAFWKNLPLRMFESKTKRTCFFCVCFCCLFAFSFFIIWKILQVLSQELEHVSLHSTFHLFVQMHHFIPYSPLHAKAHCIHPFHMQLHFKSNYM